MTPVNLCVLAAERLLSHTNVCQSHTCVQGLEVALVFMLWWMWSGSWSMRSEEFKAVCLWLGYTAGRTPNKSDFYFVLLICNLGHFLMWWFDVQWCPQKIFVGVVRCGRLKMLWWHAKLVLGPPCPIGFQGSNFPGGCPWPLRGGGVDVAPVWTFRSDSMWLFSY